MCQGIAEIAEASTAEAWLCIIQINLLVTQILKMMTLNSQ